MAVGEVYLLDLERLARYYGSGKDEFHLVHNFVFQSQPWKAEAFRAVVDEFTAMLPSDAWPAWMLSNHDVSRIATRYDEGGNGEARARVAAMLLLTLRGTPFVYMGDEIGQADGEIADRVVDVDGRDPERTPVQWDMSPPAGGGPWLPVGAQAAESTWPPSATTRSMLSLYRRLSGTARAPTPSTTATTIPCPTPPAATPPARRGDGGACWSP